MSLSRVPLLLVAVASASCATVNIPGVHDSISRSDLCGASRGCGVAGTNTVPFKDPPLVRNSDELKYLVGTVDSITSSRSLLRNPTPCKPDLPAAAVDGATNGPLVTGKITQTSTVDGTLGAELGANLKNIQVLKSGSASASVDAALSRALTTQLNFETHVYTLKPDTFTQYAQSGCANPSLRQVVRRSVAVMQFQGSSNETFKQKLKAELKAAASGTAGVVDVNGNLDAALGNEIDKTVDNVLSKSSYILVAGYDLP